MTDQIKSGGEIARLAQLLCDQTLRRAPGNRDETIDLLDAALSRTPAKAGEDGVERAQIVAWLRGLHWTHRDHKAGQQFAEAIERGEHVAALSSIEETRGE